MFVYADNAATTRLSETALAAMLPCLREQYGNPSSLHAAGQAASGVLVRARETMARLLGCAPHELVFTSGGSESDNQALLSTAALGAAQGRRHIVSTAFEHHAVLHTLNRLRARGFDVTLLPVHEDGVVTAADIAAALRPDTCLVSVMYANNEIGTIQPADEIGALCRAQGVLFHTDAVQAAGHLPIDLAAQPIDLLSLSAHKFHGPKGVGLLYARRGVHLTPLIDGGAQERPRRAGTENVAGIVGLGVAMENAIATMEEKNAKLRRMQDRLINEILKIDRSRLNGDREKRLAILKDPHVGAFGPMWIFAFFLAECGCFAQIYAKRQRGLFMQRFEKCLYLISSEFFCHAVDPPGRSIQACDAVCKKRLIQGFAFAQVAAKASIDEARSTCSGRVQTGCLNSLVYDGIGFFRHVHELRKRYRKERRHLGSRFAAYELADQTLQKDGTAKGAIKNRPYG